MNPSLPIRGFTLIELLVVLGIITLLAGGLGLALRDGESARALEAAQATVASLVSAARVEAVLHQNRTMLVFDADPSGDCFLRGVQVAVESAPDSGRWRIAGPGAVLPRGICVVPGSVGVVGATFAADDAQPGTWPEERQSTLEMMPAGSILNGADNPSGKYLGMSVPLTSKGLAGVGVSVKLVLAAVRRAPPGLIFDHPDQVRGIALSSYGVAILLNDARAFDF